MLSWPFIYELLESKHADCWLPKNGFLPNEKKLASGILSFEQVIYGFGAGRTLLIRHAENKNKTLKEIATDFSNTFQGPVDIQIYCTPENEEGFNWHYDVEEVFVIQSLGEKEFYLRPNTVTPRPLSKKLPLDLNFETEPFKTEIRCHLKAGDFLYIPSGYWHKARALTPSFHMSVGVLCN